MKTTRTIVTTLLLVAAMLIGAVLVPATFAANEPAEPYDGEAYVSTATTNAPLPEPVEEPYYGEDNFTEVLMHHDSAMPWLATDSVNRNIFNYDEVSKVLNIIKDSAEFVEKRVGAGVFPAYDIKIVLSDGENQHRVYISTLNNMVYLMIESDVFVYEIPDSASSYIDDVYQSFRGVSHETFCVLNQLNTASEAYGMFYAEDKTLRFDLDTVKAIWQEVYDNAVFAGEFVDFDFHGSDVIIYTKYDDYIREEIWIDFETKQVFIGVYHHLEDAFVSIYQGVYNMESVENIQKFAYGFDCLDQQMKVQLNDEIIANLQRMAYDQGLTIGINLQDVYDVYYGQGHFIQASLNIISAFQTRFGYDMYDYDLNKAKTANNWEDLRESTLVLAAIYIDAATQENVEMFKDNLVIDRIYRSYMEDHGDVVSMMYYSLWIESLIPVNN